MPYIGKSPSFGVRNRFVYVASSGATSVSGADANGATLTFTDGAYVDVYLNGVLLKPTTDYNTSTANTIAGLSALNTNDEVTVVVYDVFTVGDMVSATSGGTFSGAVTLSGGVSSSLTIANNLTLTNGDIIFGTSGNGINLGVTSNTDSNTLDDYEEGDYTVAFTCGSSGSVTLKSDYNTGYYTKVGRLVTVFGDIRVQSVSSPAGDMRISLPFTVLNNSKARAIGVVLIYGLAVQSNQKGGYIVQANFNSTYGILGYQKDNETHGNLTTIGANDEIKFTVTYQV